MACGAIEAAAEAPEGRFVHPGALDRPGSTQQHEPALLGGKRTDLSRISGAFRRGRCLAGTGHLLTTS